MEFLTLRWTPFCLLGRRVRRGVLFFRGAGGWDRSARCSSRGGRREIAGSASPFRAASVFRVIFASCGGAPHGSGCGGRRAADFAPRSDFAPAGGLGRAIAAAWAPGGERRELWVCGKIWPEIWSPSDYGAHAILRRVISSSNGMPVANTVLGFAPGESGTRAKPCFA